MNEIESFAQLELRAPLLEVLTEVGYETPTPIQAACIPAILAGRDLVGEAQTGTGKTAAFALPLLQRLDLEQLVPQALVLTPTRELAIQVAEAFQKYAHRMPGFHVLPVYGGQSMVLQLRQLKRGVHVIVGTPGRVMDHLERKSLDLSGLRAMVLDEADEMLRMGFIDDVEWILEHTPAERQTALFSATLPDPIRRVAQRYLRDPVEVKIRSATTTVATTRQMYWQVRGADKLEALTRMLEVEDDLDAALVFVRTKTATVELADRLEARGYAAAAINGDMNQALRERVIEQLRGGALDILVATDVAARGIDVPRVSHVINYDLPYDIDAYVHRIGRTGRAGRSGTAILFVENREMRLLRAIERATRQPIEPIGLPSQAAVADRRVAQFKAQIVEVLEGEKLDFMKEMVRSLEQEQELDAHDIAAALAWLAQRERPLQPEAPELAPGRRDAPHSQPYREGDGPRPAPRPRTGLSGLVRYRIEVGRAHGVMPKEIVGAIANEGGIEGREIGDIRLLDEFSLVELPADLSAETLHLLQRARVRQRPLALRPLGDDEVYDERPPRPPRDSGRFERGGPRGRDDRPFARERTAFAGPGPNDYGDRNGPRRDRDGGRPERSDGPPQFDRPRRDAYPADRPRPYRGDAGPEGGGRPFRSEGGPEGSGRPPYRGGGTAEGGGRSFRSEGSPEGSGRPPYRGGGAEGGGRPPYGDSRPAREEYRPDRGGRDFRPERPAQDYRPDPRGGEFRPQRSGGEGRPEGAPGVFRSDRGDVRSDRPARRETVFRPEGSEAGFRPRRFEGAPRPEGGANRPDRPGRPPFRGERPGSGGDQRPGGTKFPKRRP